jgi:hypothetical protein
MGAVAGMRAALETALAADRARPVKGDAVR